MESVPTTVDDGGTPDDGTDDVVVADGLSALGTFKLASNDAGNPLPVELVEFAAALDGTDAVLRWRTASETDNAGFQVQHQPPNRSRFTDEGFVDGAGTTTAPQTYRYRVSDLVPGRHRFRLEQVDADGATHRSNPVSVTVETRSLALEVVGPLPVRQSTQVAFTLKQSGPATVALYNVLGERVSVFYDETASAGSRHTVEISTDGLPSGIYFVRLVAPTGSRTSKVTVVR